jgi:hypothetical protein
MPLNIFQKINYLTDTVQLLGIISVIGGDNLGLWGTYAYIIYNDPAGNM